jgi:hypothetical protein
MIAIVSPYQTRIENIQEGYSCGLEMRIAQLPKDNTLTRAKFTLVKGNRLASAEENIHVIVSQHKKFTATSKSANLMSSNMMNGKF